MKKVLRSVAILLLLAACNSVTKQAPKEQRPNIIVILLDDAGYVDFGFMGSEDLETPNIDALAKSGTVFTDAHVSATVCAPSRAGLITGIYQQRFGFEANGTGDAQSGDLGLADDVTTMAEVLKEGGYTTIALGKWHLGGTPTDHPNQRGFDEFYGFLTGSRSYFPLENPNEYRMLQHNGKRIAFEGYMTDVLGDASVRYVKENKDSPFFMYLAYNAVHTPMHAKEEHLKKYEGHPRKELAAMTWSLDENIGRLQQELKSLGIAENTLIFFLSDNGGAHNNQSSSGPLKGWKGSKFEGGHRIPFVVSWPKKIEGGGMFGGLTSSLDIFATAVAAAAIPLEELPELDGVDLMPFLIGEKKGNPHKQLFWRKLEETAARSGDHKLIRLDDFGHVLYDLNKDLGETQDLSKERPEELNAILQKLESWEHTLLEPLWVEGRDWMDVTYHVHKQLMTNDTIYYKSPGGMKGYLEKQKNDDGNN
ncbi:sulfatase-like hydrolase/transferase [Muricauda sp. SCSIO 64092]|uniref:sulfatase-like hydrolase/transferase n=1 Tax=Allomuricauda sp. SCSIO 64092 TaxID=2908842 RepID=UPI001FF47FED|nr:sulfatase-like hydrolase/transferase [Muricauda sp. SCSIO 64092]UOY06126.1 sulfatase-like hydrolase/transferase [Muricauda sp. SCSIO 64092]